MSFNTQHLNPPLLIVYYDSFIVQDGAELFHDLLTEITNTRKVQFITRPVH
jgi:hypothetical protein